jgi:hypothetical protein
MKRTILLLVAISATLTAQNFKRTATSGFTFLQVPMSARDAALGETGLAGADPGPLGLFLNPAGPAFGMQSSAVGLSYSPWLAGISHYGVAYASPFGFGLVGVSANVMDYGTIDRTVRQVGTREFASAGTFSARSMAFGLSYGRRLTDKFAFGLTLKYVEERIDVYAASNVLLDGGMIYYTGFQTLRLAAVIQNFGTNSKFVNDEFRMPSTLRLGAAMELLGGSGEPLRVTAMAVALHPSDNEERVHAGLEVAWQESITLRYGHKFGYDEEDHSFGLGLRSNLGLPVDLDFAYVLFGRLGDVVRMSVQVEL